MKKLAVLAIFALASVIYAGEDTPIRNVCDSLTVSDNAVIDIVPAYIDETNWYGNPATWAEDSTTYKRHWSYKTLEIKAKSFTDMLPVSIHAGCLETRATEFKYATWNNSKAWTEKIAGNYATYIYDIHNFQIEGRDTSNTYNFLAYVSGKIPEDDVYTASSLLPSKTFEFAFEWWFVGISYEVVFDTVIDGKTYTATRSHYSSSVSNDSLNAFEGAKKRAEFPEGQRSVRVQFVKVVLSDSRKLPEPESSSSVPASSSSSVPASSSSVNPGTSSSHSVDVSSSSVAGSSSSGAVASSSSQNGGSSSSVTPGTSSSAGDNGSSSSTNPGTSSGAETSSSGTEPQSSSSDDKTRLVTVQQQNASARVVQVRALDGSVVKNQANLAPGVYYVKNSNGKWQKMAVLPR